MKLLVAVCLSLTLTACVSDHALNSELAEREAAHSEDSAAHGFSPWERVRTAPLASPGAVVSQVVGADSWVRIAYHRPAANGRDVWTAVGRYGPIVPRNGEPSPWRAGANEPTTLELSQDLLLEGEPLAAGKYVLMMIPRDNTWSIVVQSYAGNAGTGQFNPDLTVLSVPVKPMAAPHLERLTYGFDGELPDATTAWMHWAELKVPFTFSQAN